MNNEDLTDYYQTLVAEFKKIVVQRFKDPNPDPETSALASLEMIRVAKKYKDKFGEKTHAS